MPQSLKAKSTTMLFVMWLVIAFKAVAQDFDFDDDFELLETSAASTANLEFLSEGKSPNSLDQLRAMEQVFSELVDVVSPATVNIAVGEAQGSGVVVSRDGFILTAAHVIDRPNLDATITFPDGSKANAVTLGINPKYDSGMLKIIDKGKWPAVEIGESDSLQKGQWVMAIGHPGGWSDSRGLVFRSGRIVDLSESTITTDCTLVGGDSGGPLIDLDGFVIGIHSRIGGRLTDNFHVPIDQFSNDWDEMATKVIIGSSKAYLGISLDDEDKKICKIASVNPNAAAGQGGMKEGDVIIKINETNVKSQRSFRLAMAKLKPAEKATFVVQREDEEVELEITMGYGKTR
ncbi:MAG: trypsin-like peptidase domain-containing protein [Planctomycetota bacterium]